MKIRVIIPVVGPEHDQTVLDEISSALSPDCEVSVRSLSRGTASIESRYAESLNLHEIIRLARQAEQDRVDGVFVDCLSGAISTIREVIDTPVIGAFEPAVYAAAMVADRFSIVTPVESVVPMLRSMARQIGVAERLASIRSFGIPVVQLGDLEPLSKSLVSASIKAVEEDGAEAIVLGCTGILKVVRTVSDALVDHGCPAPVINPTTAAIGTLEMLIRNRLAQSRLTYSRASDMGIILASGVSGSGFGPDGGST